MLFIFTVEVSPPPFGTMTRQLAQDRMACGAGSRAHQRGRAAIALCVLLGLFLAAAPAREGHAETAALVIDPDSGVVHYGYRVDTPHPPASLTKMMTIYLAFEALRDGQLKPGQRLKVSRSAAHQRPSRLGLRRGRTIDVEDAILALVTKSANDAAVVVAEAIAGSETAFAGRMTARARELGMTQTVFRNASGLHHPAQTTTARDMARLAIALIRDFPDQYRLFSRESFVWSGRRYKNHNSMLTSYDGADGVKTGYIRQSGYNLVASAQRNGHRLVGVVLGGETIRQREWMMATMLDYGFLRSGDGKAPADLPELPYILDPPDVADLDTALRGGTSSDPPWGDARQASASEAMQDADRSNGLSGWSIQVGAYISAPPAEEAAMHAVSRIPALLGHARILVTSAVRNGRPVFRARLTGLSEDAARTSCRQLAVYEIPCLVVADTGEFRAGNQVH